MGRDGRLIVEANVETSTAGGRSVILCPCGAGTMLPGDWEIDDS
jgi:hypothetical protein